MMITKKTNLFAFFAFFFYYFFFVVGISLTTAAFIHNPSSSSLSSSFTGRTSSVCNRDELTTELSCPPIRSDLSRFRRGTTMGMPPFLKKLGLTKPDKPIFGGEKEEGGGGGVAVLEKEPAVEEKTRALEMTTNEAAVVSEEEEEEEMSETQKLMQQVKDAGIAGVISYALWEVGFWAVSVPVCVAGYRELTGHWPDFSNPEDMEKLGAEAFAFVNFARFAVPLRIGLALSTTPWIQNNIVDQFMNKDDTTMTNGAEE